MRSYDLHLYEPDIRADFKDRYNVPLKQEMSGVVYLSLLLYLLQIQIPAQTMPHLVFWGNILFWIPSFFGEAVLHQRVGVDTMAYINQGG